MKILIVTVAGMSTRFSESMGEPCLKCLYYRKNIKESLLYQMLHQYREFDKYVIVGGFKYNELAETIEKFYSDYANKLVLVNNKYYDKYGSGYSLYLGMQAALEYTPDEIMFAEGDLFVDRDSFNRVVMNDKSVITVNSETINAKKSVVFYLNTEERVRYIYDVKHNELEISEPFIEIYNSGQIWKFVDYERIRQVFLDMYIEEWYGTNLVFVQKYFSEISRKQYDVIRFNKWINCNTINDFEKMQREMDRS